MSAYDPITSEDTFTDIDYRWLASRHGLSNSKTFLLNAEAFKEESFPNGRIRGGQTLGRDGDNKAVPFVDEASTPFIGCLAWDRSVSHGDELCAVMWHGLVNKEFLPESAVVPTDSGQITFR